MTRLLNLLGMLGGKLPVLRNLEWDNIFEFIEYFLIVQQEGHEINTTEVDWHRIKEILSLLGKIKD